MAVIDEIDNVVMLKNISTKEYADVGGYADKIAKRHKNDLKTTQLRKFFGVVKSFEHKNKWEDVEVEFYLLKPKLAAARGRKVGGKPLIPLDFYNVVMKMMEKVDVGSENDKIENLEVFINFFEAIVAYHRFYNAKGN